MEAASTIQPGDFEDDGSLGGVQRSNLALSISFIEWREPFQTRQRHRSFDLSRPLISEFKTLFVQILTFLPYNEKTRSALRAERVQHLSSTSVERRDRLRPA